MRSTYMTQEDIEFMDMRNEIFHYIPEGSQHWKKWKAFRDYMDFYYKNLPGMEELDIED